MAGRSRICHSSGLAYLEYVETVDIYTFKRFLHPFMRESEPAQVGGGVEL